MPCPSTTAPSCKSKHDPSHRHHGGRVWFVFVMLSCLTKAYKSLLSYLFLIFMLQCLLEECKAALVYWEIICKFSKHLEHVTRKLSCQWIDLEMRIKVISLPFSTLGAFTGAFKDMEALDSGERFRGSSTWWWQVSLKDRWVRIPAATRCVSYLIPRFRSFSVWLTTRKHGELWNSVLVLGTCLRSLLRSRQWRSDILGVGR